MHAFFLTGSLLFDQVASIELCAWLGGLQEHKGPDSQAFMTIEDVGKFLEGKGNDGASSHGEDTRVLTLAS